MARLWRTPAAASLVDAARFSALTRLDTDHAATLRDRSRDLGAGVAQANSPRRDLVVPLAVTLRTLVHMGPGVSSSWRLDPWQV
jgi:hypothetical protein